jgi:serine/threonine-protein kinase
MNPFPSTTPPDADSEFRDPELTRLAHELTERVLAGEPVDPEQLARDHPGQGPELQRILTTVRILARAAGGDTLTAGRLRPGADFHDFHLVRELGRGGMGVVFEAQQRSLGRRVALKTLTVVAAIDERSRLRFEREARSAASLRHPHIVPVFGFDAEGHPPYLVMQLIDGASLAHVIDAARRLSRGPDATPRVLGLLRGEPPAGPPSREAEATEPEAAAPPPTTAAENAPLPEDVPGRFGAEYVRRVAQLGLQAAEALAYAHGEGVIHRDIKPANLLLDRDGRLWIVDFGLAKLASDPAPTLTRHPIGTAHYMSPEQADPARDEVDGRTDVYSLGVTLYELLTLRRAFPDEDYRRILHEEPPPIRRRNPSVPRDLETILETAMAKDRDLRFPGAAAMAQELRRFLADQPLTIRRQTTWDRAARWTGRNFRRLAVGAAVAMLSVVLVLAVLLGAYRGARRERDRAEAIRDVLYDVISSASLSNEQLTHFLPLGEDDIHAALERMVAACESGLRQIPGASADRRLRHSAALAHYNFALSLHERGQVANRPATLLHLGRAITLLSELTREYPKRTRLHYNLVRALMMRSSLYLDSPALRGPETAASDRARRRAEADALEALRVAEKLVEDHPQRRDCRDLLAFQHYNVAVIFQGSHRLEKTEHHARVALRIATELTREPSELRSVFLNNVFRARCTLAGVARSRGRLDEAERELREALHVHEELSRTGPYQRNYDDERASTQRALAGLLIEQRRYDEAEALLLEALETARRYARLFPRHERHASTQYGLLNDLGRLYATAGRRDRAENAFYLLIATLEILCAADPPPALPARSLMDVYENCPLLELRDPEKARTLRVALKPD